jgi:hypothetical protein
MNTKKLIGTFAPALAGVFLLCSLGGYSRAADPFVGAWELTIPGGGAGWLGVSDDGGKLSARLLWGGGSVLPVDETKLDGDTLVLTRHQRLRRGGSSDQIITATREGDDLHLTALTRAADGKESGKTSFSGKLQPPLPPAPHLSKVKFGEPIQLFNGHDLTGWRLAEPKAFNGWKAENGLLINDQSTPGKHYGNLRTDREFEDFKLTLETKLAPRGNSGVYLRGIYEVQVADTHDRNPDPHNMGAIYSRITPIENVEKKPGEWQTLDITLVDRHATVILNGHKIIDNQPIEGCTGGALWSDVTKPGPILLQGDHTGITYRNIVLRPVLK